MWFKCIIISLILLTGWNAWSQSGAWQGMEAEADTLLEHDDNEGALKIYSTLIERAKPDFKPVLPVFFKRAQCYYRLNNMAWALKDLNVFIPENPENLQALLMRAFAYKELGETDLQLADLNHVVAAQPRNPDLLKWRSSVFMEKGNFARAKKDLQAVKAIQDDPETEMYLGMSYYNEGHADSALLSLNQAIALDVTFLPSYLYASSVCLQEEQYDLVLKYVNVALKIEPQNKTAIFYKGIALVELKQEKEGCRCLTRALRAGEDEAVGYLKEYCYGVEE